MIHLHPPLGSVQKPEDAVQQLLNVLVADEHLVRRAQELVGGGRSRVAARDHVQQEVLGLRGDAVLGDELVAGEGHDLADVRDAVVGGVGGVRGVVVVVVVAVVGAGAGAGAVVYGHPLHGLEHRLDLAQGVH